MSNPNLSAESGNGIQALLYVRFIIEKRYRVDEVAPKMGIASDTLYKYIRGENLFPMERAGALTAATGDTCYLDYAADQSGYILVPKPTVKAVQKSVRQLEALITIQNGKLVEVTEAGLEDGSFDQAEIKKIIANGNEVVRAVETLKAAVKAEVCK